MTSKMVAKYQKMFRLVVFSLLIVLQGVVARKHHLKLERDKRPVITMSSFGFLKKGVLLVNVTDLSVPDPLKISNQTVGFTLGVSKSSGAEGYMEEYPDKCVMRADVDQGGTDEDVKKQVFSIVFFRIDFKKLRVEVERKGKDLQNLIIVTNMTAEQFRAPVPSGSKTVSRRKRVLPEPVPKKGSMDANGNNDGEKAKDIVTETIEKPPEVRDKPDGGAKSEPPPKAGSQDKGKDAKSEPPAKADSPDKGKDAKSEPPAKADSPDKGKDAKSEPPAKADSPDKGKDAKSEPLPKADSRGKGKDAKSEPPPKAGSQDKGKDESEKDQPKAAATWPVILKEIPMARKETDSYSFNFLVAVTRTEEEGMYNLNFHNCLTDTISGENEVSITLDIVEDNDGNYLSAGAMPLPTLYFLLSFIYIVVAIIWNTVLCKSQDAVYKMHYLMLVVVFVKSLSCLFHAVNYHFIMKEGIHEEAWAVLYYIAYLTRGALLFVTIILIGSGWAFIKHVLSDREKKLFLIFIPLQILDNIASIIVEESEEGQSQYTVWKEIFILIDLLCCGAILFPVVWSIKHLQEASRANGKEMLSLTKLKLFRQFYIMVVCYIYFTRIIVYLLKLTVPFKYEWLDELFKELATIIFFVITGYKFRPATDNPYLQVPSEDEEQEMDEVLVGESANLDTVKKVNQGQKEETTGVKLRESSHEYD